jgi:hypothetical protein
MLGPLSESMNEYFSSLDDNPLGRGLLWNTVLNLNEKDQKNIEILRAFETAGLDHRNPFHWRKLLECFAKAHFGKKKTKPKKWDAFEFCVLLKDYLDVTRNHPELKASEACKLLINTDIITSTHYENSSDRPAVQNTTCICVILKCVIPFFKKLEMSASAGTFLGMNLSESR